MSSYVATLHLNGKKLILYNQSGTKCAAFFRSKYNITLSFGYIMLYIKTPP